MHAKNMSNTSPCKGGRAAFFKASTLCPKSAQQDTDSTSTILPAVTRLVCHSALQGASQPALTARLPSVECALIFTAA